MSISAEIEKLSSLRDRGDLSPAEFEKAKAILLSDGGMDSQPAPSPIPASLEKMIKQRETHLLCAVLTAVAAALNGVAILLNPSALKIVTMILWSVASIFWWSSYLQLKSKIAKIQG